MSNNNIYINLIAQADKLRRHNRQGSYKTRERYYDALKRFCRFLADVYRLEKLSNIAPKHVQAYTEALKEKGLSASTIKTDLSAIRFFHDQMPNPRHKLPDNKTLETIRRQYGRVDRTWSDMEIELMLYECRKANRRDYAACIIIARNAGLRIHEVMRIDTATALAALGNRFITIKGKGGKVRDVPINESICISLREFLALTPAGQKLFVPQGKQTHQAIKELQQFIIARRKFVQDSDSTRPMTFHGLRHTCAAEWHMRLMIEGKTERQAKLQVSKWLGHEREDVTRVYLASVKNGGGSDV